MGPGSGDGAPLDVGLDDAVVKTLLVREKRSVYRDNGPLLLRNNPEIP